MDSSRAELQEKIKAQGDVVRKLKAEKAEKNLVRFSDLDMYTVYFIIKIQINAHLSVNYRIFHLWRAISTI